MILSNFLKEEPVSYLLRKVWRLAKGRRYLLIVEYTFQTISQLLGLLDPIIFALFVNEIQKNGLENINYLLFLLSLFILLTLLIWLFHGTSRVMGKYTAYTLEAKYANYLLKGLFDLGVQWHADRDSGEIIDKVKKSSQAIFAFTQNFYIYIRVFIRLVGISVILLFFNIYIGIFAFFITIMALFILFRFDKYIVALIKQMIKDQNKISAGIFDALSNVSTIIILHIQKPIMKNLHKLYWIPWKGYKKSSKLTELKWFTGEFIFELLVILPIAGYLLYLYKNNIAVQIGTITALYMYLSRISQVFYSLAHTYETTMIRKANLQNAEDLEEAIENSKRTKKKKIENWDILSISNLNFSYHEKEDKNLHLENINIDIKKGEKVALIGQSGSGKTTFLKVLHGMYPEAEAQVSFDGKPGFLTSFSDLDLGTMLVPQEPEIFSSTIKENITLGLSVKKEELDRVINLASFGDVVDKLPKGLKSVINEKGVNLSGGQKQRLALARALLFARGKDILLLDESTSSVDPASESRIYENIFDEYSDKTVLASIHKMNLLKYFDRIVIFKEGKIVDMGTFEELLKRNKDFKKEWDEFVKEGI